MKSRPKWDILNAIDSHFLDEFISNVNNVPRYHQFKSKEELINFCTKKFTKEQIYEIFDSFKARISPIELARKMRELNGRNIGLRFIEKMKPKYYSFEVNMNGSICDIVTLDSKLKLNAIEIKANGDNVKKAPKQCEKYRRWAELVYILTEDKKYNLIKSIIPSWIGLITYKKESDKFLIESPKKTNVPDLSFILENISKEKLVMLAKNYKIKTSGEKKILVSRLKPLLKNENFVNNLKITLLK
jgi:hypothetical protein